MDRRVPPFTELYQDSCGKVATSHTMVLLVTGPSTERHFEDKNCILKHTGPGILFMADRWPHVVFGKVKRGMHNVEALEHLGYGNGKTSKMITVSICGQL